VDYKGSENKIIIILKNAQTIAVIGISKDPKKISREIASLLKSVGYKIYGINPSIKEDQLDGIEIYNSISEVPSDIDIVNIFRKSEDIPFLIDDILKVNPRVVWLQLGIRNDEAVAPLIEKGIEVIQDECIYVKYKQYISSV